MSYSIYALVIDNNRDSRSSFKRALSHLGCKVFEAGSTEDGIKELSKKPYNAVFTSLNKQNTEAKEIAQWVKTNCPSTKFFIVTGREAKTDKNFLPSDGIDGVIHKPIMFSEIRDTLIEHLG